jgi:hypothetical protein
MVPPESGGSLSPEQEPLFDMQASPITDSQEAAKLTTSKKDLERRIGFLDRGETEPTGCTKAIGPLK